VLLHDPIGVLTLCLQKLQIINFFKKIQFSKSSGSFYDKIYKYSHPTNIQDTPT